MENLNVSQRDLPRSRTCCMCGAPMVEVRTRDDFRATWQEWQCPRCLHTEHDRYDDYLEEEEHAGPAEVD